MTRHGMVIDIGSCIGCYNCVMACKDEHIGNEWPPYAAPQPDAGHFWMKLQEKERVLPQIVKVQYKPIPCMQCRDAPCQKAAREGAVYTRSDGIVIIDPIKAKGQRQIVESCPYKVIYWNEEKQAPEIKQQDDGHGSGSAPGIAQKCTFCAHLIDRGWKQPRCVESCPTNALIFGDMDDPKSEISQLIKSGVTETMNPELGIDTAVRYIGLPKPMIGGSVIFSDTTECASNVGVSINDESGQNIVVTKTNNYGDFLIDRLGAGKTYVVKLEHPKYSTKEIKEIKIDGTDTVSLGEIVLQKR